MNIRKAVPGIIRILAFALGGLAVLLAAGYLVIQTGWFRTMVRDRIVAAYGDSLNGRLSIGEVEGDLLSGIRLKDVTLLLDGDRLVHVDGIAADYSLPALLRRKIAVSRLVLDRPSVRLVRGAGGAWSVDRLVPERTGGRKKEPDGSPWAVSVGELVVRGASFRAVRKPGGGGEEVLLDVPRFDLEAGVRLPGDGSGLTVDIREGAVDAERPRIRNGRFAGTVRYDGSAVRAEEFSVSVGGSRGTIDGSVRRLGTDMPPLVDVRADFPEVSFEDLRAYVPGLAFDGTFATGIRLSGTPERLEVVNTLGYRGLSVESTGTVKPRALALDLESRVRGFDPREVLPGCSGAEREACPAGDVDADISVSVSGGSLAEMNGSLTVTLHPSRLAGMRIRGAAIRASAENGVVTVMPSRIATPAGTLRFRASADVAGWLGDVRPGRVKASADIEDLDIARLPVPGGIDVRSDLDLRAELDLQEETRGVAGSLAVAAGTSTVAGLTVSRMRLDAEYDDGVTSIDRLEIAAGESTVSARGTIGPDGGIRFEYDLLAADLGALKELVPADRTGGRLTAVGTVSGSLRRLSVKGTVRGEGLRYGGLAADSLEAVVDAGGFREGLPVGTASVSMRNTVAGGVSLESLQAQASSSGGAVSFSTMLQKDGDTSARLAGIVRPRDPDGMRIALDTFVLTTGETAWRNAGTIDGTAGEDGIRVSSFRLENGGQSIAMAGRIGREGRLGFSLDVSGLSVGAAARAAGCEPEVRGVLDLAASLSGTADRPVLTGDLSVSGAGAGDFHAGTVSAGFGYEDRALSFSLKAGSPGRTLLSADGRIPVDLSLNAAGRRLADSGLDVSVASRGLDLSFLVPLLDAVDEASGPLRLDARLTGDPARPDIDGSLFLSDASLRLEATGVTYTDIDGSIELGREALEIRSLTMKSGEGRAKIEGRVYLVDMVPAAADLSIDASKFKAMDTGLFSGTVDAGLRVERAGRGSRLSGSMTVLEADVGIPSAKPRSVEEIRIIETDEAGRKEVLREGQGTPPGIIRNTAIDADLVIPGNTWVRGSGLNAEIEGRLRFRREQGGGDVSVTGAINVVRGTYEFRGKLLKITEGTVSFGGGPRIDPSLSVRATSEIADLTVIVLVSGTVSKPEVTLKSIPMRDESDILSYLLFGKSAKGLSPEEDRALQRMTVKIVGDLAAQGLRDILGSELAPDVIDIQSGARSGFGVGKYITSRLFLRYEWRFGIDNVTQTIIDYQINRYLNLRSQIGDERTSGVDLFLRFDY